MNQAYFLGRKGNLKVAASPNWMKTIQAEIRFGVGFMNLFMELLSLVQCSVFPLGRHSRLAATSYPLVLSLTLS